jgi:hypothetical protein
VATQFGVRPDLSNPKFFHTVNNVRAAIVSPAGRALIMAFRGSTKAHHERLQPRGIFGVSLRLLDDDVRRGRELIRQPRRQPRRLYHGQWSSDLSMAEITAEVAAMHGLALAVVRGASREKAVVRARQEAMWRCCRETGHSTTSVGRFFQRDHTTVVHAVQKIERMQKGRDGNG